MDKMIASNPFGGWLTRQLTTNTEGSIATRERRVYCVLVGNILLEFNSADEAAHGAAAPKAMMEIVGASSSEIGDSVSGPLSQRFMFVTAAGTICQASADDKELWVGAMTLGINSSLEASNPPAVRQSIPTPGLSESITCAESGQYFTLTNPRHHCISCGGAYLSESASREIPLLHHGKELAVRVCNRCRFCQELISVLRAHNGVMLMYLREVKMVNNALSEMVASRGKQHKKKSTLGVLGVPLAESFKAASLSSPPLSDTGKKHREALVIRHCRRWFKTTQEHSLLEAQMLSTDEFLELMAVRQLAFSDKVNALACDRNVSCLVRLLYDNVRATANSECVDLASFQLVLAALTSITNGTAGHAQEDINGEESSVDFNLPQILHIFFLMLPAKLSSTRTEKVLECDSVADATEGVKDDKEEEAELVEESAAPEVVGAEVDGRGGSGRSVTAVRLRSNSASESLVAKSSGCSLCGLVEDLIKLELLRDFILHLCEMSLTVGMRVVWSLLGYLEDARAAFDKTTPQSELLDSKKAWIALFALDVEATVASQGRPLGSCFGDSRGLFTKLFRPTPAQMSALLTETSILERYRGSFQLPPRSWVSDQHRSPLSSSSACSSSTTPTATEEAGSSSPRHSSMTEDSVVVADSCDFYRQLSFTSTLTSIAEKMRFVDPKNRSDALKEELIALNQAPWRLGFFPIQSLGHPLCPVIRMPATEGYVFKTKARAPTLVLFEILRPERSSASREPTMPIPTSSPKKESPLSSPVPIRKPPLHMDSPPLSARPNSFSSSFKLDDTDNEGNRISELTEVEGLIGDQIERRLTRSSSLDESALLNPRKKSFDFDLEDLNISESGSDQNNEEGEDDEKRFDSESKSVSPLVVESNSRKPYQVPARSEVRMMVREHSSILPSSQLDRNLVEDQFNTHNPTELKEPLVSNTNLTGKDLSDLEVASAAAAAAVATSLSKKVGLNHASIGAQAAVSAAATTETMTRCSSGERLMLKTKSSENIGSLNLPSTRKKGPPRQASVAVKRARVLHASGSISADELNIFIEADKQFQDQMDESLALDEKFCVSRAFGESWEERKERIRMESPDGHRKEWDLVGLIIKSNDDLRQEVCALQLIELSRNLFDSAGLPLFLRSYRIISTDASTGVIELLADAISLDALKKRQLQRNHNAAKEGNALSGTGLAAHFDATYGTDTPRGFDARWRFASSLAAYSAVCHVFAIKDRHNGNILLDTEGHLIHIDFGFLLGIAPGGAFSIETAPFKLTDEMIQVLGDVQSKLFSEFVLLFSCAFLALQAGYADISGLIEVMCDQSTFPCFEGTNKADVLQRLHTRLRPDLDKRESVGFAIDLIRQSMGSTLTRQYDNFQWLTNGIVP